MSNIAHGRKAVTAAGTPVQIPQSSCRAVAVQALATNTGVVAVGGSNTVRAAAAAAQNGIILSAGQSVSVDTDDSSDVWIDAAVNGEGVTYLIETVS